MVSSVCLTVICFAGISVTMPTAKASCFCHRTYSPVCSVGGLTYPNLCFLECSGATYLHDGECTGLRKRSAVGQQRTVEPEDIPCICTSIYLPVCGIDGTTYDNDCNKKCANVELAHNGACDELSTKAPFKN